LRDPFSASTEDYGRADKAIGNKAKLDTVFFVLIYFFSGQYQTRPTCLPGAVDIGQSQKDS
jgi:hypothetical protein